MTSSRAPELIGLVLAGGDSSRMGVDKGELRYRGVPQARYLWELLKRNLGRCFVSVNAAQRDLTTYRDLPLIVDSEPRFGPATGLLAAFESEPRAAWLVAAVDLINLDDTLIRALIAGREPSLAATAMQHGNGMIEPLIAIWEPGALALLRERAASGYTSPRRCLEVSDVRILRCSRPSMLTSVDSPSEQAAALRGRTRGA